MSDLLASYPVVIDCDVRWGDMDALGHLNLPDDVRRRVESLERSVKES